MEADAVRDMNAKLDALLVVTTRIDERVGNQGDQLIDHEARIRQNTSDIAGLKEREGRVQWSTIWPVLSVGIAGGGLIATLLLR